MHVVYVLARQKSQENNAWLIFTKQKKKNKITQKMYICVVSLKWQLIFIRTINFLSHDEPMTDKWRNHKAYQPPNSSEFKSNFFVHEILSFVNSSRSEKKKRKNNTWFTTKNRHTYKTIDRHFCHQGYRAAKISIETTIRLLV